MRGDASHLSERKRTSLTQDNNGIRGKRFKEEGNRPHSHSSKMPRSFLVCRRTRGGTGTGSGGKHRRRRPLCGDDGICVVEQAVLDQTKIKFPAVDEWCLTSARCDRGLATDTEQSATATTDDNEISPRPSPSSTEFRWTFDSDDEGRNGNLPMALFGTGKNCYFNFHNASEIKRQ